jgi:hypothetical protein
MSTQLQLPLPEVPLPEPSGLPAELRMLAEATKILDSQGRPGAGLRVSRRQIHLIWMRTGQGERWGEHPLIDADTERRLLRNRMRRLRVRV